MKNKYVSMKFGLKLHPWTHRAPHLAHKIQIGTNQKALP